MDTYLKAKNSDLFPRKNSDYMYFLGWVIICINILTIVFYNDFARNQILIGALILITSLILMIRVRKTKALFFLISIITYINASVAVIDCFYGGEMFNAYQMPFRTSEYNQIYAKNILLNITILSLMMTPSIIKKAIESNTAINSIKRKNNAWISYAGLAFIVYALISGYERGEGTGYASSAKTIYEYAILVFLFVWYYSKNNFVVNMLLMLFAFIYIIQGLYYGDRSSALVFIVLIAMIYVKKIPVMRMLSMAFGGIVVANFIADYRNLTSWSLGQITENLINRGSLLLFSDTASQSYYSGITIIASRLLVPEHQLYYLYKFILAIFVGGSSKIANDSNITLVVQNFFHNGGGGMYPSYFYFWGGYIGAIFGAIILGIIIRNVFTKKTSFYMLMQLYLTVMAFRWYLYTPITLFRTSILIFCMVYLICHIVSKLTRRTV
jgi:hypothetical protein